MQASPTRGQARRLPALLALALLASCGTLDNGRGWGQDATLLPGWSRIGSAARKAALDPFTWVPLALAVGLSIDRMDHEIGDWAAENTPIFGSNRAADDFSDHARKALQQLSTVTPLLTDSGDEPGPWMAAKLRGLGVRAISTESRRLLTESTKVWVGRGRPDDSDRRSMPSGHTSAAFNYARWISEDLNHVSLDPHLIEGARFASWWTAAGVGWARVEAGQHYPADVLAGAALGNFVTLFAYEAFLGIDDPGAGPRLSIGADSESFRVGLHWSF